MTTKRTTPAEKAVLLSQLNTLRKANGMPYIPVWSDPPVLSQFEMFSLGSAL